MKSLQKKDNGNNGNWRERERERDPILSLSSIVTIIYDNDNYLARSARAQKYKLGTLKRCYIMEKD